MNQKTKFIIFGLIGISVIFLFLYIQTLGSKQVILKERNTLKEENTSLNTKLSKLQVSLREYEDKISLLNKDLDKVSKGKQELQSKYELATKARDELAEKLKSLQGQVVTPLREEVEVAPPTIDAYWGSVLKAKTDLELQLSKIRDELKSMQISNEQLQREKGTLQLDINSLESERSDLKRQLDYNQSLLDSISQELVREKNDKIKILESFKTIKNTNNILLQQVKSLTNRRAYLDKKLQELQEEKVGIERKFSEMEAMLAEKISHVDNLKQQLEAIRSNEKQEAPLEKRESVVELPPIVVRPQPEPGMQETLRVPVLVGKILAVNKENNFVIIDIGEDSGIKIGDTFQVYRENKPVATVEVIQIRKNISACDIKRETAPIKIGDTISK